VSEAAVAARCSISRTSALSFRGSPNAGGKDRKRQRTCPPAPERRSDLRELPRLVALISAASIHLRGRLNLSL